MVESARPEDKGEKMSMELAQNLKQQVSSWPPLEQVGAGLGLVAMAVLCYWLGDRDDKNDAGCFLWAVALLLGVAGISIVARAL
jgi:hypothetical protein